VERALLDADASVARDERRGALRLEVVEIGARLPSDPRSRPRSRDW
jgi:hypothetical protein